jgi:hypothetical protein
MKKPLEWEREFIERLADQPLGKKAWAKLQTAGLGDFAKYLLYQGYAFGDSIPAEVSKGLGQINSAVSKLLYAGDVAREREDDPEARKFKARLNRKLNDLAATEWPYQNPEVRTFADAVCTYGPIGALTLSEITVDNGKARQNVTRYGPKLLLVPLRAGAKARGVDLTLAELTELAYAANEDTNPLDKNTLQRFFKLPDVSLMEAAWQRHFEASEAWDVQDLASINEAVMRELAGIQRDSSGLENSP